MRYLILCAVVVLFLVAVSAATLGRNPSEAPPAAVPASSAQVTLDGVPVCVFSHAGQIIAGVGRCGAEVQVPPPAAAPPDASAGQRLPPGHPPIGPDGQGFDAPERLIAI